MTAFRSLLEKFLYPEDCEEFIVRLKEMYTSSEPSELLPQLWYSPQHGSDNNRSDLAKIIGLVLGDKISVTPHELDDTKVNIIISDVPIRMKSRIFTFPNSERYHLNHLYYSASLLEILGSNKDEIMNWWFTTQTNLSLPEIRVTLCE